MKSGQSSPLIDSNSSQNNSSSSEGSPCKLNMSKRGGVKRKQDDSAGDTVSSSSSDSDIEVESVTSRKHLSPKRRCIRNALSKQDCASPKQTLYRKMIDRCVDAVDSKSESSDTQLSKECTKNPQININSPNNLSTDRFLNDNKGVLGQFDSGISSQEVYSSQEYDLQPAKLRRIDAQRCLTAEGSGTDDTELLIMQGKTSSNTLIKASPLSAKSSSSSEASVESGISVTTLKQRSSDLEFVSNESNKLRQQPESMSSKSNDSDESNICSLCFDNEKSAVFVHTKKACSGCCYTCAMKTWKKYKVCPFCKEKAKNVIKLFSH